MFRFGLAVAAAFLSIAPAQSMPPSPLPAGPGPAIIPVCQERSYLVFFGSGSARLDAEARFILDALMKDARRNDFGDIVVTGHSDRAGDVGANGALAWARVAAVASFLTEAGMPPGRIAMRAAGEDEPLVPTSDGVAERFNRRVEIVRSWSDPPCGPVTDPP